MAYDPAERRARYYREKARNINLDDYAQNRRRPNTRSLVPSKRIRAILELHEITIDEFATAMQLSRSTAHSLCSGRARINTAHAIRLSSVLGGDVMDWLRLQAEHNLRQERALLSAEFTGLANYFETPDHL
ncbi:helix-turn-helix transcriptional regulator [Kluyvera sichuanensis]|uniref:helix-turn-helix transcriptional regulator n=1 Tax=Kluyvera sichuanensis TaxID=2725494 RepID=UPI003A0FEE27